MELRTFYCATHLHRNKYLGDKFLLIGKKLLRNEERDLVNKHKSLIFKILTFL